MSARLYPKRGQWHFPNSQRTTASIRLCRDFLFASFQELHNMPFCCGWFQPTYCNIALNPHQAEREAYRQVCGLCDRCRHQTDVWSQTTSVPQQPWWTVTDWLYYTTQSTAPFQPGQHLMAEPHNALSHARKHRTLPASAPHPYANRQLWFCAYHFSQKETKQRANWIIVHLSMAPCNYARHQASHRLTPRHNDPQPIVRHPRFRAVVQYCYAPNSDWATRPRFPKNLSTPQSWPTTATDTSRWIQA